MSALNSGKYYAVPVDSADPSYTIELDVCSDTFSASGQRATEQAAVEEKPGEDIQKAIKGAVDEVKKGGWKAALSLGKRALEKAMEDDKPAPKAPEPDLMDPAVAFSFDQDARVSYQAVKSLNDKEQPLNYYQFRSARGYGVLIPKGDGVFQEVSFIYPSHEYAEKHYPALHVGHSVPDWRREDDQLHRMRVYFLSEDQSKAQAAAKAANFDQLQTDYFAVDLGSTRAGEKTRFSTPELDLDPRSGDLSMNFLRTWFLPTSTKSGRQIQYNWDALRVSITQDKQTLARKVCWPTNRGREVVSSQHNHFELMSGGYFCALSPGQYELRVHIYDTEMMVYPFEVVEVTTDNLRSEFDRYLVLKTPADHFVRIKQCLDSFELDVYLPLTRHLDRFAAQEKIEVSCRIEQNGKAWPDYELDFFASSNMKQDREVLNKAKWWQQPLHLQIPFADRAEVQGRQAAADGEYQLIFESQGQVLEQLTMVMKDGVLQGYEGVQSLPLADFDFPKENSGVLLAL